MDFIDFEDTDNMLELGDKFDSTIGVLGIQSLVDKCKGISSLESEEATKISLILPMITALGYDIHNNKELKAEYVADVGIKKGEKVDYAIIIDNQPLIIIEAKQVGVDLSKNISQLYRYFSVTNAKIGILTDGIRYLFFTDYKKENLMDTEPYMYINMKDFGEFEMSMLLLYSKNVFKPEEVRNHVRYNFMYNKAKRLVKGIFNRDIDKDLIDIFAKEVGIKNVDKGLVDDMFESEFNRVSKEKFLTMVDLRNLGKDTEIQDNTKKNKIFKVVKSNTDLTREYNIGEVNVHGYKIEYANILGDIFDNISYANLLVELLNKIYKIKPENIKNLIDNSDFSTGRYSKITRDLDKTRKPRELECGGIFIETHLGGPDLIKLTMQVMDKCGIGYDKVRLKLRK